MARRERKADLRMFPDEIERPPSKSHNQTNNLFVQNNPAFDKKDPGAVQAYMDTLPDWNRPGVKSDEELLIRWDAFFRECYERDVRPTIEGLACAAGVDYATLRDWESGKHKPTPERASIVKKAKSYVRYILASMATRGQVNPVTFIFMAKNYFGMQDKVEHVVETSNILSSDVSADDVRAKVISSVPNLEDIKSFDDFEVMEPVKESRYEKKKK